MENTQKVKLPLKKISGGFLVPTKKGEFVVRNFFDADAVFGSADGIDVKQEDGTLIKEIYGVTLDEKDQDSVDHIIEILEKDDDIQQDAVVKNWIGITGDELASQLISRFDSIQNEEVRKMGKSAFADAVRWAETELKAKNL